MDLLNDYRNALVSKKFLNPSERAIRQAAEFVYHPPGRIAHGGSVNSIDPSDRGDNHGVIVIADALCSKLLHRNIHKPKREVQGPPLMSLAWRRQQREGNEREYIETW